MFFISAMAPYSITALLLLFLHCFISLTQSLNSGFSVELIHRDSLKSPFYSSSENQFQKVTNALRRSINRAKINVSTNTIESTITSAKGEYLMTYSVGTPPFKVYGIVDTGSDIVWLQCKPCEMCYKESSPIFDPSKSKTYRTIPCNSSKCRSVPETSCSNNNVRTCKYTINYGDGSRSQGDLSVETLTLESTNGSHISFPKTVIGCGHSNTVTFTGKNSGVVGLGGGPESLTTQIGSSIGRKFSYCLVPIFSDSNTSSKLNFGDAAVVFGNGTVSTPLVQPDQDTFYYLTLEAFSVGNKRIEFGNTSFGSTEEANIVIDSGTTLTLLPGDVYSKLESAVKVAVKLKSVEDPTKQLSLCYKKQLRYFKVPMITAHFRGADVKLNALNTFVEVDDGVVCFAFAPTQSYVIFGNIAQQNLLVGFDLEKRVVSFEHKDCTKH